MTHEEVVENKLLLTPEEKEKVFKDYPCLDPSFEDDYKTEVELLLEAQLAKAKPIIEKEMLGQIWELLERYKVHKPNGYLPDPLTYKIPREVRQALQSQLEEG